MSNFAENHSIHGNSRFTVRLNGRAIGAVLGVGLSLLVFAGPTRFVQSQADGQESPQTLRLKLERDSAYRLVFTQETSQTTSVAGKEVKMTSLMVMEVLWKVTQIADDGKLTVTQKFDRFRIRLVSDQAEPLDYDSDLVDEAEGYAYDLSEVLAPFLEGELEVVMTGRGKIESVTIPPDMMKSLREVNGSMQLRQLLSPEGLQQLLTSSLAVFPEQAVAKGDTWEVDRQTSLPQGSLKQKLTYALVGQESYQPAEDIAATEAVRIDVKTELEFEQPEDNIRRPQKITSQDFNGSIWIDPQTNMFAGSKFTSRLETETPFRDANLKTVATGNFSLVVSPANDTPDETSDESTDQQQ